MATERTLSIIKPDATRRNLTGKINACSRRRGCASSRRSGCSSPQAQAEAFYAVHKERPFFGGLVSFMTSGPVVVQVLEGEDAVARNREVMGATDPKKAEPGTIRAQFAEDIEANSVHGSDSPENAAAEIAFFFAGTRSSADQRLRGRTNMNSAIALLGRILMSAIFIQGGIGKALAPAATIAYMSHLSIARAEPAPTSLRCWWSCWAGSRCWSAGAPAGPARCWRSGASRTALVAHYHPGDREPDDPFHEEHRDGGRIPAARRLGRRPVQRGPALSTRGHRCERHHNQAPA